MNNYHLTDIYIGMTEQFTIDMTEKNLNCFYQISGDSNPMHTDSAYARLVGYKEKIVYGMCTASLYSTLVGVYLPGKYCLFKKCEVEWPAPVYVGDVLTVKGVVKEIDEKFNTIRIYAEIRNQDMVKVSRAKLTVQINEVDFNE